MPSSEEKREPVSDIDTGVVDSLKALDPNGRLEKRKSSRCQDCRILLRFNSDHPAGIDPKVFAAGRSCLWLEQADVSRERYQVILRELSTVCFIRALALPVRPLCWNS